jgi:rRNA processing protein Gar1
MSGRIVSHIGNQVVAESSSKDVPDLRSNVYANGRKIGSVFDLIGNVEKPYIVVRLLSSDSRIVVGSDVSWSG